MRSQSLTNFLLLIIAVALIAIAVRPLFLPAPAQAQLTSPYPLYIEPGTQNLRVPDGSGQVFGRVVVDMRTGKIWGFPTNTLDPYPVNSVETKPQVSHPFVLGRFAFEEMDR